MSQVLDADGYLADSDAAAPAAATWRHRMKVGVQRDINAIIILSGIVLLVALYFAPQIFITVHSGEVGVMYLRFGGGTQTDRVLGEGMKIVMPWDRLYIYNIRIQEEKHELEVLSNEGLPIKLDLSIRYHPEVELVGLLHQQVGPDYAAKIVIPEVESALRTTMAAEPLRNVYGAQPATLQTIINEAVEKVSHKFIQVDQVIVLHMTLPVKVAAAIEDKMTQKEIAESYEFRIDLATKEAERLKIEATGQKTYQDILNTSLTPNILRWEGIQATKELAKSPNAKTIVVGDKSGLPLILGEK